MFKKCQVCGILPFRDFPTTGEDQEENGISSAFTCADGFRGCFDPWPSLSNKYHRSRGNTIIRSRQGRPFVGGVRSRWLSVPNHGVVLNTRHNHVISAASSCWPVSLFHRFLNTSLLPSAIFIFTQIHFHSRDACSMQLKAQSSPVVIVICNFPINGQLSKRSISDGFFRARYITCGCRAF